jgi:hypothetical protein
MLVVGGGKKKPAAVQCTVHHHFDYSAITAMGYFILPFWLQCITENMRNFYVFLISDFQKRLEDLQQMINDDVTD